MMPHMESGQESIPKIIHYVWVGPNELPQSAKQCIQSWKKYLSDYELKLWNEKNSPMDHPFVKRMYDEKKWAFVSDYIRFWVLFREGGVYLDTDTEVLKSLNPLLEEKAFFGRTSSDGFVSCGIIGARAGHPFIKEILHAYDAMGEDGSHATSPQTVTKTYDAYVGGEEVTVFEPSYFYPCSVGEVCTKEKLAGAFTTHHWAETWVSFRLLRKFLRRIGVLSVLKRLFKS